jgi:transcriptional regulator with XRE-family HTH domain
MPGTHIKRIREQKKITQEEVARQMGISQNAYSKIENNITQLTINHIKLISTALDVSPLELMRGDFILQKPAAVEQEAITKETILRSLELLKEQVSSLPHNTHDLYPVLMADLQAADNVLHNIPTN